MDFERTTTEFIPSTAGPFFEPDEFIDTQYFFNLASQDIPEYAVPWHWMASSIESLPTDPCNTKVKFLPAPASEYPPDCQFDETGFSTAQPPPALHTFQQPAEFNLPTSQTSPYKDIIQISTRNRHSGQGTATWINAPDLSNYQSAPEPPKKKARRKSTNGQLLGNKKDSRGRYNKLLERNRRAAAKCRDRKQQEADALISEVEELQDQHQQLLFTYVDLREQIFHLKSEILKHGDCDYVLIQQYISKEAHKTVDNLARKGSSSKDKNWIMTSRQDGSGNGNGLQGMIFG
ncbi:hypothetical protein FPOAC2_14515 [Fusarium poae]|jgi:hypothetical protein|uniref:BZIP domain-containing protein n=1 Tax=Fusarium poae TaxID=36050 RepID=A0A1B8A6L5_FUSPO|nr:uncharacterized protein FPOAC1_013238 [Fusarium poae]KAG8665259.1 hypothetical protein FPOAC1_013238 [Fusarium poae]OBS15538.1 hypothetical protein FPOA_13616 [Fusarium poae]OBS15688.1 hypothetical protein FPOA_13521 [Fusarium poae]OBS16116.1 hypothetical protein FPOA_13190 [Fusarium poae]